MSELHIDPMVPFEHQGEKYTVHMDACARGVIKLPSGEHLVVAHCLESYPPHIVEVREAHEEEWVTETAVYDATPVQG